MTHIFEGKTQLDEAERHIFGQRIVTARQKYQISQKTIAAQMHCTQAHISKMEHGIYAFRDTYERVFDSIAEIVVKRQEAEQKRYLASVRQQVAMGASA